MKFGYFCNSTNWNNSKSYTQLLKEIREIAEYCDSNDWNSIWFTEHHFSHEGMEICPNPLMLSADMLLELETFVLDKQLLLLLTGILFV